MTIHSMIPSDEYRKKWDDIFKPADRQNPPEYLNGCPILEEDELIKRLEYELDYRAKATLAEAEIAHEHLKRLINIPESGKCTQNQKKNF